MSASEEAVAAVSQALGCLAWGVGYFLKGLPMTCRAHMGKQWIDRGCPVAVAAADAAVDTDRASIQAQALRGYASELDWTRPPKCPCEHPEHCCGSEQSCDAMQPVTRVVGAVNLRARADRIEATT